MFGTIVLCFFWACAQAQVQQNIFVRHTKTVGPIKAVQDIGFLVRSKIDCAKQCSKDGTCGQFRFHEIDGRKCWFKKGGRENVERYKKCKKHKVHFEDGAEYHIGFSKTQLVWKCFGPGTSLMKRVHYKQYGGVRVHIVVKAHDHCPPFIAKRVGCEIRFAAPSFQRKPWYLTMDQDEDFNGLMIGPIKSKWRKDSNEPISFRKLNNGFFCMALKNQCRNLIMEGTERAGGKIIGLSFNAPIRSSRAIQFYVKKVTKRHERFNAHESGKYDLKVIDLNHL